jgi:hypothetical protein
MLTGKGRAVAKFNPMAGFVADPDQQLHGRALGQNAAGHRQSRRDDIAHGDALTGQFPDHAIEVCRVERNPRTFRPAAPCTRKIAQTPARMEQITRRPVSSIVTGIAQAGDPSFVEPHHESRTGQGQCPGHLARPRPRAPGRVQWARHAQGQHRQTAAEHPAPVNASQTSRGMVRKRVPLFMMPLFCPDCPFHI